VPRAARIGHQESGSQATSAWDQISRPSHALGQFAHLVLGAFQLRVEIQRPAIEFQRRLPCAIILQHVTSSPGGECAGIERTIFCS